MDTEKKGALSRWGDKSQVPPKLRKLTGQLHHGTRGELARLRGWWEQNLWAGPGGAIEEREGPEEKNRGGD